MALIACRECKQLLSDQAAACPHCGAPKSRNPYAAPATEGSRLKEFILAIGGLFIFFGVLASYIVKDKQSGGNSSNSSECADTDLQCLGDAGTISAGLRCAPEVERLAKNSMRWTDGTFEPKFSRFRWSNKEPGTLTFIGDKAEFQNGFGAYVRVIYECDLSRDFKEVIDVRVEPGRIS